MYPTKSQNMSLPEPVYPELLSDLFDIFKELFKNKNISDPSQLSHDTVLCLSRHLGGIQIYIPAVHIKIDTVLRNIKIKEAHSNGESAMSLAIKYKLSVSHVHDIISGRKKKILNIAKAVEP